MNEKKLKLIVKMQQINLYQRMRENVSMLRVMMIRLLKLMKMVKDL